MPDDNNQGSRTPAPVVNRALIRADEPFLWEMLYHALFVSPGQPPLPRSIVHEPQISRYVNGWGQPADMGVVALDGGQRVGAAWLRLLTGGKKGFGYVDDFTPELSMAVLPAYRGRGIGSQLLAALLERADRGSRAISLSVAGANPARRLYQRFGFQVVREDATSLTMIRPPGQ